MASAHDGVSQGEGAWLLHSTKTLKRSGFFMQQAIEEASLDEALRHSAVMLGELRTNALGPLKYFELYMTALNMLNVLEQYFMEYITSHDTETAARGLYQRVQHAGNVIPRLYLLCTVGSCVVKTCPDLAVKVMRDMEDMCKGVQHPIRGLFLRAYLLHCVKSILPDDESSVRFLLENFIEMNKLWVRMKLQDGMYHMGAKTREQLADLVGKNLTQLSHLEYLDYDVYSTRVLPKILDQVVSCNDTLAQGYLMECVTAAFPDEFQVGTIDQLLLVLPKLHPTVDLSSVLGAMLDRLAQYSENGGDDVIRRLDEIEAFVKIQRAVHASIVAHHDDMSGEAIVSLYGGLLTFATSVYPERIQYADEILGRVHGVFRHDGGKELDGRAEKKIIHVLCIPLETYPLETTLGIENFTHLVHVVSVEKKKELAYTVAGMISQRGDVISEYASAQSLFDIVDVLALGDADDVSTFSKMVHCFKIEPGRKRIEFLSEVSHGIQARETSVRYIGPSLVLSSLDVLRTGDVDSSQYIFPIHVAQKVADAGGQAVALSLLLRTAVACSHVASEKILYECFERACILFEDYIHDSTQCRVCLSSILDALYHVDTLDPETRDMLAFKTQSYCSKLLRRKDQCQAMMECSRVYWQEHGVKNGAMVLETLSRAERTIHALQEQNSIMERSEQDARVPGYLLVELLAHYISFKTLGVHEIHTDDIQRIVDLARKEVASEVCQHDDVLQKYCSVTCSRVDRI